MKLKGSQIDMAQETTNNPRNDRTRTAEESNEKLPSSINSADNNFVSSDVDNCIVISEELKKRMLKQHRNNPRKLKKRMLKQHRNNPRKLKKRMLKQHRNNPRKLKKRMLKQHRNNPRKLEKRMLKQHRNNPRKLKKDY